MLNRIIDYSLKNRLFIIILASALMAVGLLISRKIEIDVFPDLTAPTVVVLTDAHGIAAEDIERLVTYPIETALNGAANVRRVRSNSSAGVSIVWVEFNWGMEIYRARQIVSEKLGIIANQMPEGVNAPILAPQTSIMGEIMLVAVSSDTMSLFDLRTIAETQVKQNLLSVTGVSQVVVMGGLPKEYQILADPNKMRYYDVSLHELLKMSENINTDISGGIINEFGKEYYVRAIGRTRDVNEIANTVVKIREGKPVKISDVARVQLGSPTLIGDAFLNGERAVILTVLKQPNTNTIELTEKIDRALASLGSTIPEGVDLNSRIFRQADFINTAVQNVFRVLLEGGIFVSLVLFLFLMNGRSTAISLIAIPLSLLVAMIVLKILGLTVNTMSLGGMAIATGVLVDDAIIDVENVLKRLKQNHQKKKQDREGSIKVIYLASTEIRSSIVQATLIIIVAFVPLFFLSGMEGRMLRPLGITFIVSLFASMLVALTLTPVLSSFFLTSDSQLNRNIKGENRMVQRINVWYEKSVMKMIAARKILISGAGILLIISVFLIFRLGRSFLPEFNEGTLTITTVGLPGISLEESNKLNGMIDRELSDFPEITYISRRTGRAELNEHSHGGSNSSEIDIPFILTDRSQEEFMEEVRARLSRVTGLNITVGQPLSHRIDHMLSGTRANIAIKVFGDDLETMFGLANSIEEEIIDVPGLVDLNVEQMLEIPQIQIRPRREMLARYGIPLNELTEFVEVAIAGHKVSEVYEDNLSVNIVLRYDEQYRNTIEALRDTYIDTWDGQKIPLRYVADIVSYTGPNSINRENIRRKLVVSANVAGRDVGSVVKDVMSKVNASVSIPEGCRIEYGGQFESANQASRMLFLTSILAILVIFMILYQEFKSFKLAMVVLINLPLALIGGVFIIWITSGTLSIPAIIGFITLFGIATRNGILLVSRYQHLRQEGKSLLESLREGSSDRLNPILMTALATALALIPLAIQGHKPGNEIQSPMAVVILGGLLTSTLLNMYIIPAVYYMINKKNENEDI